MADDNVHEINAKKAIAMIKAAEGMIPRLQNIDPTRQKAFRALLNVPEAFMPTAAMLAANAPEFEGTRRITPEQTLDTLQYLQAYEVFRTELYATLKRVDYTLQAVQAELASESLLVYAVARAHARRRMDMHIKVQQMRQLLGRRGPKRGKKKGGEEGAAE